MSSPIRADADSATIPVASVVVFGAAGVGKSSLIRRFLKNNFTEIYRPTVEKTYSAVLQTLNGSCVRLVLIDTAGLHPFPAMRELRMRTGQVFLFVFSYDSPDSLDEAIRLFYELKRVKGERFDSGSVIFVGNKSDLLTAPQSKNCSQPTLAETNVIPEVQTVPRLSEDYPTESPSKVCLDLHVKSRAKILGKLDCSLIETSARQDRNVLELFHAALWPTLSNGPHFSLTASPARHSGPSPSEESPLQRKREPTPVKKKISWPWRNNSDNSTTGTLESSYSPNEMRSPARTHPMSTDRRRKTGCIENAMITSSYLCAPKENNKRKFSMGSHLCHGKNNHYLVVDDQFNRPASRSHSVDNSLVKRSEICRDSNPTCSTYSDRSYSSVSSIEKENLRKLSVQSDNWSRFGRFLTPSPKRTSRDYDCMAELCPFTLDFVQEVGHFLDPGQNSEESRVPQVPCFQTTNRRRGHSPQPLWDKMKKPVFGNSSAYCLDEEIHEAKESTSPGNEHEFNLVVPELVFETISATDETTKSPSCKLS